MTFLEIQNAVLSDRFDETKRDEAKRWINSRYGRIWASEPWSFKVQPFTLSLSQGASTLALTGIQRVLSIYDGYGSGYTGMEGIRPEDFHRYAYTGSSLPRGFTVMGNLLYLDRPASSARTLTVVGEARFEELVDDTDEPLIPEEFHSMLIHGATSEGLREENDPTWQGAEQDYQANLNDMKAAYLTSVRTYGDAAPAWP